MIDAGIHSRHIKDARIVRALTSRWSGYDACLCHEAIISQCKTDLARALKHGKLVLEWSEIADEEKAGQTNGARHV